METNFKKIFVEKNIICIDYYTPGIDLAIALQHEIKKYKDTPKIIFLQNHGLIITSDNAEEIIKINENVLMQVEKFKYRYGKI